MKRIRITLILIATLAAIIGVSFLQGAVASADTPTPAEVTPPKTPKVYNFTWYDSLPQNGMAGDWIVIGNLESHETTAQVYFGKEEDPRGTYTIPARGRQPVSWPNTMGGPVKVVSPNGDTLVVTQRVLYRDSFNEVAAVEKSNLGNPVGSGDEISYYFTWYDSLPVNGMRGNWILISNEGQQTAAVDVYIASTSMGSYEIAPGEQITPQYPNTIGGPVRVTSTNGQQLIVSQRVLYGESFNEVTAVPEEQLDSMYYFTWYDMVRATGMKGNWVLMSNLNDTPVTAEVYIGTDSNPRGTYTLQPNQSVTPTFPDLMDGPVRVECTDCGTTKKILVSQRVLFKDSFEEVQGTPPAGLSDELYFGWYDSKRENSMTGNWILIANQGVGNATVDVYLGASETPLDTYIIPEGGRVTPQYWERMDGPVRVTSRERQPLMVSQRVLYKSSFNELLGLTRDAVGAPISADPDLMLYKINAYWASPADYANGELSVDLRISNVGANMAPGVDVTQITANSGVTVLTPVPIALGDIAGSGGYASFTVKYDVPDGVSGFRTGVIAECEDSSCSYPN